MPIFHLAVRTLSRSAGRSAVAAAAYRAGARLRCERTGRHYDFSRRHGVVVTRVVVPQSETTVDRQQLWNRAELAETRCNSTVAREIELALPCELDATAREALALTFAKALTARYGIAVDVAIHAPSGEGDNRNHHVHLLTSTRIWEPDGTFGRKVRQLDDRKTGPAEVVAMRESWAVMCNKALAAAGVTGTVDHRSHQERGLSDQPGQKVGPAATGLERRTGAVSRRRAEQDAERAAPERITSSPQDGKDGHGAGQAGSDRRRAQRLVLGQLRSDFATATTAAMMGRDHPALQGIHMSTASPRRQGSAAPVQRSGARRSSFTSQIRPPAPDAPSIPMMQIGKRRRKGYDEAEEAAAMYRRVDRELDAEHRAYMAEQAVEARRGAYLIAHRRPTGAFATGPSLPGVASRGRADHTVTGPTRRPASDEHAWGSISDRHDSERAAADAMPPAVDATRTEGFARQQLAIMVAHELRRRHKRSRARWHFLAEVAGMGVSAFEAEVSARDETGFDPVAIAGDATLAALWVAWGEEDRAKQRDWQDKVDVPPPTTVAEVVQPDALPVEAEPDPGHPSAVEDAVKMGAGVAAAVPAPPYTRREAVLDYAITVIARGGWSNDVGDAVAGLLRTRRDWVWREAHRRCWSRHGTERPQSLSSEVLLTVRHAALAGAEKDGHVRQVIRAIDRGRIGRGLGR